MTGTLRYANPSSILVASDLTEVDRLFPFGLEMAQETGARLILMHVLTAANSISADQSGLPFYDPIGAVQYAEETLEPYCIRARAAGVECEALVREGSAAQQIEATVRRLQVDRVILGTRSRGKLGKLLIGSVAEQVLRSVNIPVITVGPEARPTIVHTEKSLTVLLATSLRDASRPTAELACGIAQLHHAHLVVMSVLHSYDDEAKRKQVRAQLNELLSPEALCDCSAEVFVTSGNPAIEILAKAAESNTSLIVLSACERTALQSLAPDGTIYRVLAHARCPVMTLKRSKMNEPVAEQTAMAGNTTQV